MTLGGAVTAWAVAPRLADELEREARAAAQSEACGLLLGRVRSGCAEVHVAFGARNVDRRPARFRIDPVDQLSAESAASAAGLEVLGAWHSHPGGRTSPSAADLSGSAYPLLAVVALSATGQGSCAAVIEAWWVVSGAVDQPLGSPRHGFATRR